MAELHKQVDLNKYDNATFLPVMEALFLGLRVASVEVPYVPDENQVRFEEGNSTLDRKRDMQLRGIITAATHFSRYLANNPKSRIRIK